MKRDMDLVRKILLEVESWPADSPPGQVAIDSVDPRVVARHVGLLAEADFLDARNVSNSRDGEQWVVDHLTWTGHDFLDAARSDTVWRKTTGAIQKVVGSVSFEVLKAALNKAAGELMAGGLEQLGGG